MVILETPTCARLSDMDWAATAQHLTYVDKRVEFELSKTRKSLQNFRGRLQDKLIQSWGLAKYQAVVEELAAKVEALKAARKKSALFEDERGYWTFSGLGWELATDLGEFSRGYEFPEPKPLPWAEAPKFQDRPYQVEAMEALAGNTAYGPVGIELPTGAGKSTVIRNLIHALGLPALVMAPSKSIAWQLHADFTRAFGAKRVGMFGDGKKQSDRMIVVAIDDSLAKVERGSDHWLALSSKPVFFADESHLVPADSLQRVCMGLASSAPYRFFVSATQLRNDGLDLVLRGITGRIAYRKTLRELVDAGYLSRPNFRMVRVESQVRAQATGDSNKVTRNHLFYNPVVNRIAGELATKFVQESKRPTVILVEEVEQFRSLLPHLGVEARFAHGPLNKDNRESVPEEFRADDPGDLVDRFNRGDLPVLVGTSCIATGTDIQVAEALIFLRGKTSQIMVSQSVGRETRGGRLSSVFNPWTQKQKLNSIHVDFDVENIDVLHRHAESRAATYAGLYAAPKYLDRTYVRE